MEAHRSNVFIREKGEEKMSKVQQQNFTGTTNPSPQPYEKLHRELSRRAASEGMVLLKNENQILPLQEGAKVALFGAGSAKTVKGGTGSGDVNERESITIYEGMVQAGFQIVNKDWIQAYEVCYQDARETWRETILNKSGGDGLQFFDSYAQTPFYLPAGPAVTNADADTAIYVISRIAGEGNDRCQQAGDYDLTEEEEKMLNDICHYYDNVIVVVNAGGLMDLSFMDKYENIYALLMIVQPGMEGGRAFADVVSGKVSPSGKLTDSWAYRYEDYPNAATFSHNNGNVKEEYYEEGIYVGYRYFDSFDIPVRYSFGYGMTYTTFQIETQKVCVKGTDKPQISVTVNIKNTGNYSGKEVVQVYVSAPDGKLEKEYRRLCAFAKTKELTPGSSEQLELCIPVYQMASYDDMRSAWLLEAGYYGIWVGNSLAESEIKAMLDLKTEKILVKTETICPLKKELHELTLDPEKRSTRYHTWTQNGLTQQLSVLDLDLNAIETEQIDYSVENEQEDEAVQLVDKLELEQLIKLAVGKSNQERASNLGSSGISVPGSAGETSSCAVDQGIRNISLADGPAGLRLNQSYYVKDNAIVPLPFEASIEHGFFCPDIKCDGEKYYQYCTAIPVGTLLAQSWDVSLLEEIGKMIGDEMQRFRVTLWLAPGMNIHRNPLCGRNFEYFSEDPLVSGKMAAAITRGVQSVKGCGTTIKHFACNNQEDNRMGSDSIVSERALREIYLKGFETAVKESQPLSIMTSYNLVNGIHSANNYDLCTKAARREWGFGGVIMTDWMTTEQGEDCTAAGCMRAGNDLVMPGQISDQDNIRKALSDGTLSERELKDCVARLIRVILQTEI